MNEKSIKKGHSKRRAALVGVDTTCHTSSTVAVLVYVGTDNSRSTYTKKGAYLVVLNDTRVCHQHKKM